MRFVPLSAPAVPAGTGRSGRHQTASARLRLVPTTISVTPVTLEGARVRLEPLSIERHFDALAAIAFDPDIWRLGLSTMETPEDLRRYVSLALREQAEGRALPFATINTASGRVAGSTRFGNLDPRNRRAEIGWTWLARPFQRTHVNTEAKFLMLRHAFETWDCVRVELKTDVRNRRSRDAMLRMGAVEEGILRSYQISERGVVRDTVFYSVLATEWPGVKERLLAKMAR